MFVQRGELGAGRKRARNKGRNVVAAEVPAKADGVEIHRIDPSMKRTSQPEQPGWRM